MHNRKLILTFAGLGILTGIALFFIGNGQFDPGLWMLWFGSFSATLGIYAGANVVQKKVLKK